MTTIDLADRIRSLYKDDQKNPKLVYRASEIPTSYDCLTTQWFTDVLCGGVTGAEVTGFSLGIADNGSTNRRRIELSYNDKGAESGLPMSVFCKSSFDLPNRLNMGLCGAAHGEKMFYTRIRDLLDIEAPRAYFAEYNPESFASIVMLEDLSGQVEFGGRGTVMDWDRAASMVTLMANYHASMEHNEALQSGSLGIPTLVQFWQTIEALVFMEDSSNTGFRAAKEVIPERLFSRYAEVWPATKRAYMMHSDLPHTLVHNDVHLGNWYVRDGNRMGLMDWHTCSKGNWSRDFAYAISVALTPENRRLWEEDLLALYLKEVNARGGSAPDFDNAWTLYRQQLFLALAFWTNTLCPSENQPEDMQPPETAMEFIRRTATAVDDHNALDLMRP
jgi:thiamine kinase-like enzyme